MSCHTQHHVISLIDCTWESVIYHDRTAHIDVHGQMHANLGGRSRRRDTETQVGKSVLNRGMMYVGHSAALTAWVAGEVNALAPVTFRSILHHESIFLVCVDRVYWKARCAVPDRLPLRVVTRTCLY